MRAPAREIPASASRLGAPRLAWLLVAGAAVVGASAALDGWALANLHNEAAAIEDWARLLRVLGYVPTWIIVALALWLGSGRAITKGPTKDGAAVVMGCVFAGIVAELVKLLVRRERPDPSHGLWSFRAWSDEPFSTSGLSFPSSHTMVAFGAAWALVMLRPRGAWLWLTLAAGTGLTRVLARGHHLSDVGASVVLAFPAAVLAVHLAERGARLVEASPLLSEVAGKPRAEGGRD